MSRTIFIAYNSFINPLPEYCMTPQYLNNNRKDRSPIIQTRINKSKDGKWFIIRTEIVEIKQVSYIQEILRSENKGGTEWQEEDQD